MNKDHFPYSIKLTAYNEVAPRGRQRILSKFLDRAGQSQISQCHHQPNWILGRPLECFSTKLVVTLGESENGHDYRETSTQGALDHAAQLCSIEEPTFHCGILSYGHL
ncbi:predicted protein [Lichtheimia corymbifera JMRC:FSU:9682]|uniref:Uncharacterized protein n=1 Tax=Lichtheimia corymbifera JMRC:FSU:9682 TaxID=1263082 RepID=A0A068RWD1_9FUNG|nr:predicted protein [Lichtheimia corymbifera JMRC:FSU:9682]